MSLSSALSSIFDSDVRVRGNNYYRRGAVLIHKGSDELIEAGVRGSRIYDVRIGWDGARLALSCDCPYYESAGLCKHIWAALLKTDERGLLSGVRRLPDREIRQVAVPLKSDGDAGEDGPEEDDSHNHDPRPAFVLQPPAPQAPAWQQKLQQVTQVSHSTSDIWPADRQLLYVLTAAGGVESPALELNLLTRQPKKAGGWKKPATPRLGRAAIGRLPDPADRQIMGLLAGAEAHLSYMYVGGYDTVPTSYRIHAPLASTVMPLMAASGRCVLRMSPNDPQLRPLQWDDGEPWSFELRLAKEDHQCVLTGWLRRGEEEMSVRTPALIAEGMVVTANRIARLQPGTPLEWAASLRKLHQIEGPVKDLEGMVAAVLEHPVGARLEVPEELRYEEVTATPRPCLTIRASRLNVWQPEQLRGELAFDYQGRRVPESPQTRGIYDAATRKLLVRDRAAEDSARAFLLGLGLTHVPVDWLNRTPGYHMGTKKLPAVAHACLEAGWHIEAEGKIFRRPGSMRVGVSSGVDWFELHGEVDYGGNMVKLPTLLAALRRGETMVRLDDGTYGLVPEEWLRKFSSLSGLGTPEAGHLRFQRNQAGLLDALLAAQPEVECDAMFTRVRDELRRFEGIEAAAQPDGFNGQLRDYQREGVGWMEFLRRFGFGGCLADDMGVGKTAQVLAVLEQRRVLRAANGNSGGDGPHEPSLVIAPRSLIFNWKQEAARFTPQLRVLDHTGLDRNLDAMGDYDVVLTTYGTLRRDAARLKDRKFDYIVLDEAQAIKNADTESAKATRLLWGRHRLALSGTPVENHLGELWSIFEFLNPGMLGAASVFKLAGSGARNPSEETRSLLAQALRPFILRRTKQQVARELPEKCEQTIFCEMEGPQRKLYDELRAHYRDSLLGRIASQGLAKSKIQVLEALLRLRQAACHPGLIDQKRCNDTSAKLEVLTNQLAEIVEEGHKALVFSQFTSLLAIVRARLKDAGVVYEYLDGATRDRQERVERFQNDPKCGVFLISLKAGGLGLNLTAAEYVFLLDPWWNPAVEAQAVDRAHRIGQTRRVFAYRLIARDTVEEKILQLQNTKRDLAAAIISADNSLIRNLKTEDLEMLLS